MDKNSIASLRFNYDLLKQLVIRSLTMKVQRIEYRTFDEGMCDAYYFICPKSTCPDALQAFVTLTTHEIHFHEMWNIKETRPDDLEYIINNHILPLLNLYEYSDLTEEKANGEAGSIVGAIEGHIRENKKRLNTRYPERWGIYFNNELCDSDEHLLPLISPMQEPVIGLFTEWNEYGFFYETPDNYVSFYWATGA